MKDKARSLNESISVMPATVSPATHSESAVARLAWLAGTTLGVPIVVVAQHHEGDEQLQFCSGLPLPWATAARLPRSHGLAGLLGPAGAPLIAGDLPRDARLAAHPLAAAGVRACAALPLCAAGQQIGGFMVADRAPRAWRPDQLELLGALAGQAAALLSLRAEQGRAAALEAALRESEARAELLLDTLARYRDQSGSAMAESESTTRALLNAMPDIMFRINEQGRFLDYKVPRDSELFVPPEQFLGRLIEHVMPEAVAEQTRHSLAQALQTGETQFFEYQLALEGDKITDYEARVVPIGGEAIAIVRDITERKRLEAQFLQIQKIESVGQLAGGIAHDFNNLLTAIMGYAELAIMTLGPESEALGDVEEIHRAAERAAGLTRQLLSFARWQVMELRSVRLNDLIFDLYKLLRRLIGEDIELIILPAYEDAWVKVDPGQIEQVLVNLAINARDAMPEGGKLTIAIGQRTLSPDTARRMVGASAGDYVTLTITDTGGGMNDLVKAHLFEPFFTTKEKGRGTGLGLATCYGIIKQHGGLIEVASAVGAGTTIEIFLPQVEVDSAAGHGLLDESVGLPRGNETILLVEDEPAVRVLAARILRAQGYIVLEAENGDEALSIARQRGNAVLHMLLTDVVMPRMSGKTLAERVTAMLPDVKVLFTSGYTNDIMIYQGAIDSGLAFLQKPFTPVTLARKVREVLDR